MILGGMTTAEMKDERITLKWITVTDIKVIHVGITIGIVIALRKKMKVLIGQLLQK